MNRHPEMNESRDRSMEAQSRLLNLLQPGASLRFVYRREKGRLRFAVEGTDAEGGTGTLEEILGLTMETLRLEGLVFDAVNTEGGNSRTSGGAQWIPIEPMADVIPLKLVPNLGFQSSPCAAETSTTSVRIPAFPSAIPARWLDFVAALLLKNNPLLSIEIEFKAHRLTGKDRKELLGLLDARLSEHLQIFGENAPLGAAERYLSLWIRFAKGWRVRCRVQLAENQSAPKAVLELLANEIFGTALGSLSSATTAPGTAGFQDVYPEGWEFPQLFPPRDYFEEFSARRILNGRIPRLPRAGILLGNVESAELRVPQEMRDRHSYIVGATGTGKSTLLSNLIQQDLQAGQGVILLDPHGDLCDQVLEVVPAKRRKQVTTINPFLDGPPPGINFLDVADSPRPAWRIRFVIGELLQFFNEVWDMRNAGGPMFEMYFRNAILLLADEGVCRKSQHTLLNFARVMADRDFRNQQLEACRNEDVKLFWKDIAARAGGDSSLTNIVPYIVSKMELLTQSAFIKEMIGQPKDTLRIREKMDRGQIVICNLSKGALGATESRLLGTILLAQIFAAGLERGWQKKEQRKPVNIYVDEFQNFVSDNMASMLSEARKFGLRLILANQTLGQLATNRGQEDLTATVLGNAGHLVFFRLGIPDAERLQGFTKPFTPDDMQKLPNYHAFARILTSEGPIDPVIMKTILRETSGS